jgi:hypothetical protein
MCTTRCTPNKLQQERVAHRLDAQQFAGFLSNSFFENQILNTDNNSFTYFSGFFELGNTDKLQNTKTT